MGGLRLRSTCWVRMSVELAHDAEVAKLAPVVPALLRRAADPMCSSPRLETDAHCRCHANDRDRV